MQKIDEVTWARLFKMRRCVECGNGLIYRWTFANGIVQYKCEAEECGWTAGARDERKLKAQEQNGI